MAQRLAVKHMVREEDFQRYGEEIERSITRQAAAALADKMIREASFRSVVVDPKAKDAEPWDLYGMTRQYEFSVLVGDPTDAAQRDAEIRAARLEGYRMAAQAARDVAAITQNTPTYLSMNSLAERIRQTTMEDLDQQLKAREEAYA